MQIPNVKRKLFALFWRWRLCPWGPQPTRAADRTRNWWIERRLVHCSCASSATQASITHLANTCEAEHRPTNCKFTPGECSLKFIAWLGFTLINFFDTRMCNCPLSFLSLVSGTTEALANRTIHSYRRMAPRKYFVWYEAHALYESLSFASQKLGSRSIFGDL